MTCQSSKVESIISQAESACLRGHEDWVNTLLWVRNHTPEDAVFAVDSRYFMDTGTDVHGFRSISERSSLADYFKDSGVVSLFPGLAITLAALGFNLLGEGIRGLFDRR